AGRERCAFLVAELNAIFSFVSDDLSLFELFDFFYVQIRFFRFEHFGLFASHFGGFCAASGEEPAGQGTARTTRCGTSAGQNRAARLCVLWKLRLRLVANVLFYGSNGRGYHGAIAEFCKRFTGEQKLLF